MNRYCTNCKKEFDFSIKSMTDLDNLVCPICHAPIDKNSRKPVDQYETTRTEEAIGRGFAAIFRFFYLFYLICAIASILAFIFRVDSLLYTLTAIALGTYILQIIFRVTNFRSGIFFLPLGAALGFLLLKTPQGACLGVMTVFMIRHLIRDLFWKLISKLFRLGNN